MLLDILPLLVLIMVANGAPILTRVLFKRLPSYPCDFGLAFIDGRPLFGTHKSWNGIFSALFASGIMALLIGYPLSIGIVVATGAMAGDLFSSFIKRRLGRDEGSMFLGLDQIPESLLPALLLQSQLDLSFFHVLSLVASFLILELLISQLLYRLHIRRHPY